MNDKDKAFGVHSERGEMMYKSPIDIICSQMRTTFENDVVKAVRGVGINVDKEELVRALKYDRDQYNAGYTDGKLDAVVHGRWVQGDMYDYGDVCSRCDWDSSREPCRFNYCPNCGAKMDLEVNDA